MPCFALYSFSLLKTGGRRWRHNISSLIMQFASYTHFTISNPLHHQSIVSLVILCTSCHLFIHEAPRCRDFLPSLCNQKTTSTTKTYLTTIMTDELLGNTDWCLWADTRTTNSHRLWWLRYRLLGLDCCCCCFGFLFLFIFSIFLALLICKAQRTAENSIQLWFPAELSFLLYTERLTTAIKTSDNPWFSVVDHRQLSPKSPSLGDCRLSRPVSATVT